MNQIKNLLLEIAKIDGNVFSPVGLGKKSMDLNFPRENAEKKHLKLDTYLK
jgi:hypothetical protein